MSVLTIIDMRNNNTSVRTSSQLYDISRASITRVTGELLKDDFQMVYTGSKIVCTSCTGYPDRLIILPGFPILYLEIFLKV